MSAQPNVAQHSPGPWSACKDGRCPCAGVWSEPADHPVAEVTRGTWGDGFPNIRLRKHESGIGEVAEAFNDCIDYGSVDEATAEANARLIAAAPDLLALARQYASECAECDGTGLVSIKTFPGGIEVDNDDQPCPDCADIRAVIAKATGG